MRIKSKITNSKADKLNNRTDELNKRSNHGNFDIKIIRNESNVNFKDEIVENNKSYKMKFIEKKLFEIIENKNILLEKFVDFFYDNFNCNYRCDEYSICDQCENTREFKVNCNDYYLREISIMDTCSFKDYIDDTKYCAYNKYKDKEFDPKMDENNFNDIIQYIESKKEKK